MSSQKPPSNPRPSSTPVTRTGSTLASGARSTGKSATHKATGGQVSLAPKGIPHGFPVKASPVIAAAPSTPKAPAARFQLSNKDGILERLLQAKARAREAVKKAESAAPAHSSRDMATHGGSAAQHTSPSPSHAAAANPTQGVHGQAPVQSQVGDHKARQGLAQTGTGLPLSGEATFIQRMLAHGLSHQASVAAQPKTGHTPSKPAGVTGVKG